MQEFGFREKLKFYSPPPPPICGEDRAERPRSVLLLKQHDFRNIQLLKAGETTMDSALIEAST